MTNPLARRSLLMHLHISKWAAERSLSLSRMPSKASTEPLADYGPFSTMKRCPGPTVAAG
jgi:hypothetical protein